MSHSLDNSPAAVARISVTGRHLDLGDSLRAHIEDQVSNVAGKYFGRSADASVVIDRKAKDVGFTCSVRLHVASQLDFRGEASGRDAWSAFDAASEHVISQVRRAKQRVASHH